ncbi:MAG: dUTP diphosphatase [Candidatus Methylumidiphilus sp.]
MATPIIVRFIRLDPAAKLPSFAHKSDAGMDLVACEEITLLPSESALVRTGLAIELPPCTEAQVRPKSGLALKHQVTVLNTPGTIDEGYRGEIGVILINHGRNEFKVERGMKVAQLVVKPVLSVQIEEMTTLTDTERGTGGFGSSGT